MLVEVNEKKDHPLHVNGTQSLEGSRGIFSMRQKTVLLYIIIFIPIITIQLFAISQLYTNWKNTNNNIILTDTVKRYEVSNLSKLQFDSYLRDFNKTYNYEEYARRFENFQASLKDIARLNKLENNTVFGLTKFSDMSTEEFADRMLLKSVDLAPCTNTTLDCRYLQTQTQYKLSINKNYGKIPPRSFDWRSEGVVKPVVDQRGCQGCWAFSIVGVLESMCAIELKDYNSRSIEELLDCSLDTNGCFNGSVSIAMKFACNKKLPFVTEDEYPLTLPIQQNCSISKADYGPKIKVYQHTCTANEDYMVEMIATHGPLIAAVDATNWKNYIGGVITRACTRGESTHVVQIVGYEGYEGSDKVPDKDTPYYIVRNSFGEDFGDNGYVKIAMKHTDSWGALIQDVCGIAEQITAMDVME